MKEELILFNISNNVVKTYFFWVVQVLEINLLILEKVC